MEVRMEMEGGANVVLHRRVESEDTGGLAGVE